MPARPSRCRRKSENLERLADGEDDAVVAVHGLEAAVVVDVGADIGDGEVDAVDGDGGAELPVPTVVVGDAVVDVALDILAADRAEQFGDDGIAEEAEVYEGQRHGGLPPLVPADAGVGEEVGAVADRGAERDRAEVVADDEAE